MKWKIFGMEWKISGMECIVWNILPATEDGRFTFHSIVCPACHGSLPENIAQIFAFRWRHHVHSTV